MNATVRETWENEAEQLSKRAAHGTAWVVIGNVSVSAIRFVSTAVLARLLVPGDFGLIGMGLLFIEMVRPLGAIGFSEAVVYQRVLHNRDLSTAFWTTLVVSIVLTILTLIAARAVASFFHEPKLELIVACLGLVFILGGLSNIQAAMLSRAFQFADLAKLEISAAAVRSTAAIVLAMLGMGLWSIVWGIVIERGLKSVLIASKSGWLPHLEFRIESFRQLLDFGRSVYGHTILQYLIRNIDFLVVGRMLGASPLAFYQFAYNIPHLVMTYVAESVERTTFALYSRLEDRTEVRSSYLRTIRLMSVFVLPPMFGLYFVADEVIAVLYGAQWSAAVSPLRVLCFAAAINAIFMVNQSLLRSQGRPDLPLKWSALLFPLTVVLTIFGASYGTVGVAWAVLAVAGVNVGLVWFGLRLIRCRIIEYVKALIPGLSSAVLMLGVLWMASELAFAGNLNEVGRLVVNVSVGSLVVLGIMHALFPKDARGVWSLARRTMAGMRTGQLQG